VTNDWSFVWTLQSRLCAPRRLSASAYSSDGTFAREWRGWQPQLSNKPVIGHAPRRHGRVTAGPGTTQDKALGTRVLPSPRRILPAGMTVMVLTPRTHISANHQARRQLFWLASAVA
jgi:hypothetical protein